MRSLSQGRYEILSQLVYIEICYLSNTNIQCCYSSRYKVEVQAVHKADKCRFLFWDSQCASILGISASDLRAQMIKVGSTDRF